MIYGFLNVCHLELLAFELIAQLHPARVTAIRLPATIPLQIASRTVVSMSLSRTRRLDELDETGGRLSFWQMRWR